MQNKKARSIAKKINFKFCGAEWPFLGNYVEQKPAWTYFHLYEKAWTDTTQWLENVAHDTPTQTDTHTPPHRLASTIGC